MDALCLITEGFICSPNTEQVLVEGIGIDIAIFEPAISVDIGEQSIEIITDEPSITVDVQEDTVIEIGVEIDEPSINIGVCNEFND